MFSNDSRWDRHLPHQSYDNEMPIEVGAIFAGGKLVPKWFVHQARRYAVKEVTYEWKYPRGGALLHYFSVSDGDNLHLIYLNDKQMYWRLASSCPL